MHILGKVNHIYLDIHVGNENEPIAPKTKLGRVTLGKRQKTNKNPNISSLSKEFDPGHIVLKFLQIESYGVLKKQAPKDFTTNRTTCFKHLRKNCNRH